MRQRQRAGFTMAELLASLCVISILAAILFPVFARAREKANQAQCLSNLQQTGLALALYARDHDGHFPPRRDDLAPIGGRYLPDVRVLTCPWGVQPPTRPAPVAAPAGGRLLGAASVLGPGGRAVAVGDEGPAPYIYREGFCDDDAPETPLVADPVLERHNGGANVLFADGHVKWFSAGSYLSGSTTSPTPPGVPLPRAPTVSGLDAFRDWYGTGGTTMEGFQGPSIGGPEE